MQFLSSLSSSELSGNVGTVFQPVIIVSDGVNTAVSCDIAIRVFDFVNTVDVTLEQGLESQFEVDLFEKLLGAVLNLDVFVTLTRRINGR